MSLLTIVLLFGLAAWSEQTSCAPGKYSYEDLCLLCTPGHYCPDGETQVRCPRGEIAPGYGFIACRECPNGWYSTCESQESCLVCPKGHYCPRKNDKPRPCPVGYYSHYGATQCTKCPAGYYTTYTNSSYCFQCPMGYTCVDPAKCPEPCPAGTYQSDIMKTACEPCSEDHKCGSTTNLLQCTATSCIQAKTWKCNAKYRSPPSSLCTNMG